MDIFERLKRFKRAKDNFMALPAHARAQVLNKWTNILESEAMDLSKKEQGKVLFSLFYGARGEELVERLIKGQH